MRKRRKPIPTPEPKDELEPDLQAQVQAAADAMPLEPQPASLLKEPTVFVPEPPAVYMLWCPECNRVGPHLVVHTPECSSDPIVVRYEPVKEG